MIEQLNKTSSNNDLNQFFKLSREHVEAACIVAGRAFQNDPVAIFSYPDDEERKKKLPYGFVMIYRYGIKHGIAYAISENLEGMVIWLPPDKAHPSTWTMMRNGGFYTMRKVGLKIKATRKTIAIFSYIDSKHKEMAPFEHWYLQNIAVAPEEQGKGHGGRLLSAMINKIDDEGLPTYLETNNENNLSFYQKHGFEVIHHEIIPNTDVPLWCMLRKPI